MSTGHIIISIAEVLAALVVIVGFMYEDKVIAFEQRLKKKICRKIYNAILIYERWRNDRRVVKTYKNINIWR